MPTLDEPVSERLDLSHVTVETDEYQLVSIVRLVANPEPLNGRPVIEASRAWNSRIPLYMSVGDLEHYVTKNEIWIDPEGFPDVKRLHNKYVAVQGTFVVQVESIGRIRQ